VKPSTPEEIGSALARMRNEYAGTLTEADLADSWTAQFARWFAEAIAAGLPEPNAMLLATADAQARPSARTVLLKGYDERGFVFYTNHESRKGRDLAENPQASTVFPWFAMYRQVIVTGTVARVERAETEAYFAVRPPGARIGAWASPQSRVLRSRADLVERVAAAGERFADGAVPAPAHWGGFRLAPRTVEFWQGRADRLHDRLRFRRNGVSWVVERLAP
jgi:pyridoxamine 5'-phosphate oxidase